VFAAASPTTMAQVSDSATVFVRNKLMIAVPEGNPGGIKDLADFADDARKIALCAAEVPCGAAARKAFDAAGITAKPDTLERDVKAVLTKVELGEVDAALVYRTDVRAAGGKVEGIKFPEADKAINDYPIVVLKDATNAEGGKAFVDFVLSAEGVAVLTKAGFERP
jgi:molybdate transport system substrate-binding protein